MQSSLSRGRQDGRDWARDIAEHEELVRLSRISFGNEDYRGAGRALWRAIDPTDELSKGEVFEQCFGEEGANVSDEYIAGFIEGANEFFSEVKDQL